MSKVCTNCFKYPFDIRGCGKARMGGFAVSLLFKSAVFSVLFAFFLGGLASLFSLSPSKSIIGADKVSDFSAASAPVVQSTQSQSGQKIDLPIIMYHFILNKKTGKYVLSTDCFENDLIFIKKNGYNPIFLSQLIDFCEGRGELPNKPIMLTFDDGSVTNYTNAFPLLVKYDIKAVMCVVGAWTENNYKPCGNLKPYPTPYMNFGQLENMTKSGLVEIQNHSFDLHKGGGRNGTKINGGESFEDYLAVLQGDLLKANDLLTKNVGVTPTAVAYPFGAYCKMSERALRQLGFKAALTCNERVNKIDKDFNLFNLGRFNRPSGISTEDFFAKFN